MSKTGKVNVLYAMAHIGRTASVWAGMIVLMDCHRLSMTQSAMFVPVHYRLKRLRRANMFTRIALENYRQPGSNNLVEKNKT